MGMSIIYQLDVLSPLVSSAVGTYAVPLALVTVKVKPVSVACVNPVPFTVTVPPILAGMGGTAFA